MKSCVTERLGLFRHGFRGLFIGITPGTPCVRVCQVFFEKRQELVQKTGGLFMSQVRYNSKSNQGVVV